ncbi:MAG: S41 family peptidase [Saprospiraceae bacterium]
MTRAAYLFLFFILLTSCSRLFFGPDPEGSPIESFEYLKEEVGQRYSLFETKNLDWESISATYESQIKDSMSSEELLEVLGAYLGELQDGHVNIYTDFDYSRNWDWYLDYPSNFDMEIIERNYLGKRHWRTGPFFHTIIDSIAYVYYGSFSTPIAGKYLNALLERIEPCKGLVFDIRNNGGGKLNNVKMLASRFADTTRVPLQFYFKSGPGKDDFAGPFDYKIKPSTKTTFTKPIVILTNRKSYSAATFFPALMSAYPHVTIMGDTSGGGGGIPYHLELPNGWNFRISTSITKDAQGRDIELGIPPDVEVSLDPLAVQIGRDNIIETAFQYIQDKNSTKKEVPQIIEEDQGQE